MERLQRDKRTHTCWLLEDCFRTGVDICELRRNGGLKFKAEGLISANLIHCIKSVNRYIIGSCETWFYLKVYEIMCFGEEEKGKDWKDIENAVIKICVVSVIRIHTRHGLKKVFL